LLQEVEKAASRDDKLSSAKPATPASSPAVSAGSVSQASKAAATGKPTTASSASAQKETREMVLNRLMKLEPKELMKEIVNGHVPLNMLNQVASRLPAEMLQEAVDFLSNADDDAIMETEPSPSTQPREHSSALHCYH